MTGTLRLVVLNQVPNDRDLRRRWNELVLRVDQPQVFYTYEWALAVQRAYNEVLHPLVFLGYDKTESLRAVVALATDADSRTSFLCATTGDYCDFLSLPDHKFEFVKQVLTDLRNRALYTVTLTNLPADSTTFAALQRSAEQAGYHSFARRAYLCAQVSLRKLERRPIDNKLMLPCRTTVKRKLNGMGKSAPVRFDHARSWEAIGPILSQFAEAHVARFQATGRVSNLAQPERRVFLAELTKLLSERGWVVLTRMMSGEQTVAWNYGFQFEGSWFWYQPTFDSRLEKYSPGLCLLSKLLEEAADDPSVAVFDLGLGSEEYKEFFANQSRETLYVTLRTSLAQHAREVLRYRAASAIKASPMVEAGVRKLISGLRGDRAHVKTTSTAGNKKHID